MRNLILPLFLIAPACNPVEADTDDTDTSTDTDYGVEALAFVSEHLVGSYAGEWQMFGLDADDEVIDSYAWTDVIVGSNPRIEEDRAFVDVVDDMDGGDWTGSWSFYEGVYIAEDGGIGDYFVESEGEVTIYIEVEPDQWEATSELTNNDFQSMENVTMDNLIDGWKTSTRLVTWPDGWERHDVSVLTHAEYEDSEGDIVTVEFTSLTGYHQKFE